MSDTRQYTVPSDVLTSHLEGEAVLLHMETKEYFRLNATAASAWKELERGRDYQALVDKWCQDFEIDPADARAELDLLLAELEKRRLIVPA